MALIDPAAPPQDAPGVQPVDPDALPPEATVSRVDFGAIVLMTDDGRRLDASVPARLRGAKKVLGNAVVVGDRVHLAYESERIVVQAVEPRRNAFSRRAAGERQVEQVVAVNLDQVVIVASMRQPDLKHGLVDRVLVQCEHAGIPARIAFNKIDLSEPGEVETAIEDYAAAGAVGHAMSASHELGLDALLEACRGRRTLFVGHSGVGKSSIMARIAPGHELLAGDVNAVTGKGRHTTTAALLIRPEPGLELIDTPGVRAFALWGVDADTLQDYYPDLRDHLGNCRFNDCRHDREPGCGLRSQLEAGAIRERRFASFLKLRAELEGGYE